MFSATIIISRLHVRAASCYEGFAIAKTFKQCLTQKVSHSYKLQQSALRVRDFTSLRQPILKTLLRTDCLDNGCRRTMNVLQRKRLLDIPIAEQNATNPLIIKTNVKNNVLLYRFEKPYMYKCAIVFGGAGLIGCLAMADNVFMIMCKDLFNRNIDLYTRILDHIMPIGFITFGLIGGPVIFATMWYIIKRTVKYAILHKGGDTVTLVTYHPFKGEVKMTVPLKNISCSCGRIETKGYVPIHIKGKRTTYVLDKSGHFLNPELFDVTVGVQRF